MISREAADAQKGFRLQKIRAISVMLKLIETVDSPHVYAATEYYEDVYVKNSTAGQEKEVFEEDKNYDPTSSFTFNTPIVRNSLVSFLDIWQGKGLGVSESMYFSFYATNKIGKERETEYTRTLNITLPEKGILQHLMDKDLSDDVINAVKTYMIEEYKSQYQDKPVDGYIHVIEGWSNEEWRNFLKRIDWMFGQEDEKALKEKAIEQIKTCKHFSVQHCDGYENQIFDSLMEKFDSRQHVTDPLERFVHGAEFEVAFKDARIKAVSNTLPQHKKSIDPVWEIWKSLPDPGDKRVLSEKIQHVCPGFSQSAIEHLAVKVTRNYLETAPIKADKSFLSYRYRIYENCRDKLFQILGDRQSSATVSEQEIQSWMKMLRESAVQTIQELSINYHYDLNSTIMVEGVILELFDTCFLSFDYA